MTQLPPTPPPPLDPPPPLMEHGYEPTGPPAVWSWFIVYCVVMAVIYLLVACAGGVILVVDPRELDMDPTEAMILGIVYIGVGIVFMTPFAIAPMLPKRKWVWVFDLVIICLGLTSCCTLPACIPLLIYWLKPETKAMFGWT